MSNYYGSYIGFGSGAGAAGALPGNFYQGENYAYAMGGGPGPYDDRVQKYSIVSGGDATEVGVLTQGVFVCKGTSSTDYGYRGGGGFPTSAVIDKTSFSSDGDSVSIGATLSSVRYSMSTSSSETHGFWSGGYALTDTIEKVTFASESSIADHGNLHTARYGSAGYGSLTDGYHSGGNTGTQRDKYSFASNTTAADDGDASANHQTGSCGSSSQEYGYTFGGTVPPPAYQTIIDKIAFASSGTASVVSSLYVGTANGAQSQSASHGYASGGSSTPITDMIQSWAFASDANAEDTTYNLRAARTAMASAQY